MASIFGTNAKQVKADGQVMKAIRSVCMADTRQSR